METKYKVYSLLSPLTMIGEVVMETVIPLLMAKMIDVGISSQNVAYVLKTGLVMVLASCVSLCCGAGGARLSAVAALGFSRNLRRKLFAKVQDFSFGNTDHFQTSSLITRLTTDVTNTQNTYQMLIRGSVRAPFMLISGTIMAFMLNRNLSVIFLIAIPVLAVVLVAVGMLAFPRFKVMLGKYDLLNNDVQENLTAIRVVKSFVREEHEQNKFRITADDVRRTQVKAERFIIFVMPVMQLVVYACIIAALWFGGKMIVAGNMTTGALISFISYINQVLMSLMMLSMIFIMFIMSRASINRIVEVLDEVPEIQNPKPFHYTDSSGKTVEGVFNKVPNGRIDFEHVFFSYSKDISNTVLTDINLSIPSGATIGVIGGTGSSKSTLISMIPRLYDVLSGTVKVGGIDVRKYDLKTLRDSVAVVLQKNVLFSGTIKENLRWGDQNATDEEIIKACMASDAHEFVSSFPKGYDTDLGQGGVNISGGQKQRLCIARALLKKPKVLILDDSTSAVDTATDKRIRAALKNSLPDTTKIIIAQRITSVMDADCIYVMEDGKINGCGTHQELLKNNRIYREVYSSQTQSDGDADMAAERG